MDLPHPPTASYPRPTSTLGVAPPIIISVESLTIPALADSLSKHVLL
jgi:hypothetical protein